MQAGPVPTDDAGQPFKYLQMAPLPLYQADMPTLDKAIFSSPGVKRKRERKGLRQPRFKKAAIKPKPIISVQTLSSKSLVSCTFALDSAVKIVLTTFCMQDHSSHSQAQEEAEKEHSPEPPSSSPRDTSGRTDEAHMEVNPPQVCSPLHVSFAYSL